ncbi:NifB/NifX family molybdenum-iron cluster-binding protein [Thermococcus sp. Bubb.Bath]|uniref:NifB/NifX family molybdenum-iron cluster-binding protein n=1 Tax=Thermococcus sp. Bubb.Bath TaxID=1638242 RepID=UPI00143897BB|nr:NifB/NifX family molybdenum-iron cluster-binding protein [Thermococcus sp. Bubb.Bath]NJF26052.1 dinitrogenase iron-molybdenum cofactor [Thermococcus sp. Bubb.Bath]
MRIALPVDENLGLESPISGHFGRAKYFTFVDVEDNEIRGVEVLPVPFEEHSSGDLPNFMQENGVEVVIVYGMGRKAMEYFNQFGITVVTGAYGKVGDVVRAFIEQVLRVDPYWKERIEREKEKEGHREG